MEYGVRWNMEYGMEFVIGDPTKCGAQRVRREVDV